MPLYKNSWTPTNDGTGSGLDADLLDGNEATAFATVGQTTYVGTTAVALNRASAALALTGITSVNATNSAASLFTDNTTASISIGTGQTTSIIDIGGTGATGSINIGRATTAQTLNLGTGATAASTTKAINIGTGGATSSTTNVTIGSVNGGRTRISSLRNNIDTNIMIGSSVDVADSGPILTLGAVTAGSGLRDGVFTNVSLTGGTGTYMLGTVSVGGGAVTSIAVSWGGNRYRVGDVLTVPVLGTAITTTGASGTGTTATITVANQSVIAVTGASGTGTTATLTFAAQTNAPYPVGSRIVVYSMNPAGYDTGTSGAVVTACTTTSVSYANVTTAAFVAGGSIAILPFVVGSQVTIAGVTPTGYNQTNAAVTAITADPTTTSISYANVTTGAQTVAGTITQGAALTAASIPVATVRNVDVYVVGATGARIRLERDDLTVNAGDEYGSILFGSRDGNTNASGDLARITAVGVGISGGAALQFWTSANGSSTNLCAVFSEANTLRLYNNAGTFYQDFSIEPTSNKTLTFPDATGTILLSHATGNTAGFFDSSATTPTGTTRLNYSGYIYPTYINLVGSADTATAATHYFVETGSDGFVRPKTLANVKAEILGNTNVIFAGPTAARTYTLPDGSLTLPCLGSTTLQADNYLYLNRTGTNSVLYVRHGGTSGNIANFFASTTAGATSSTSMVSIGFDGSLTATGTITASSDIRLKKDLHLIPDALDKVKKLNGYTWTRTETEKKQTGLIAQEVQTVLPEAVVTGDDGYLSLAYGNLVGLLVEAIKEQKNNYDELLRRLEKIESNDHK